MIYNVRNVLDAVEILQTELARIKAQGDALAAAFEKYCGHKDDCPVWAWIYTDEDASEDNQPECTCGFSDAYGLPWSM